MERRLQFCRLFLLLKLAATRHPYSEHTLLPLTALLHSGQKLRCLKKQ